jgi:hypothetical protein
MLVIERTSNGRTTVRLQKDWNPNRISRAYTPPAPKPQHDRDAYVIQTALLNRGSK